MSNATDTQTGGSFILPGWLTTILQIFIIAAMPLLLVLLNARLLMTPAFVRWEYQRPNFPPDSYGFTLEERLTYGPMGLAFLFNGEPPSYLGDLTFDDGSSMFTEREVSHMVDVREVTQMLTRIGYPLLFLWMVSIGVLAASPVARPTLYQGLLSGSILTVALIVLGLIAVATSFDWLFTQFHAMFFEGDSWLFLYSDTLIRLYPERFWIDAFAFMFGGALVEALALGGVMGWLLRR